MTSHDRANMLLKTINLFMFVQRFDEMVESGDASAVSVLKRFLRSTSLPFEHAQRSGLLPLAQLTTTLSILLITVVFARQRDAGWWEKNMEDLRYYGIVCGGSKCPERPSIYHVIRTMRNAMAHGFDHEGDDAAISFPEGSVVSFRATEGVVSTVTFGHEAGFVVFLDAFLRAIKRMIREDLATGPER